MQCGATLGAKPNPTIRALALVRANLSYVELGQYTQVHGSDAACPCPFLSEIFSFVKIISEYDTLHLVSQIEAHLILIRSRL